MRNAISANNYGGATLVRMPNPMHLLIGSVISANKYEKATLVQKLVALVYSFSRGILICSQNCSSSSRNKVMDVQSEVEPTPLRGNGAFEWWVCSMVCGRHSREGGRDTDVGRSSSI